MQTPEDAHLYNFTKSELSLTLYENYNSYPDILDPYKINLTNGCDFLKKPGPQGGGCS